MVRFESAAYTTSPRGFKYAIRFGYVEAYIYGLWAKSIGLSVVLEHYEIF